jgi:hypothetical protein
MLNKNTVFGGRKHIYVGESEVTKSITYEVKHLRGMKLQQVNKTKKFLTLMSLVFFIGVFFGTVMGLMSVLNSTPSAQANAGELKQLLLPTELISSPR